MLLGRNVSEKQKRGYWKTNRSAVSVLGKCSKKLLPIPDKSGATLKGHRELGEGMSFTREGYVARTNRLKGNLQPCEKALKSVTG